MLRPALGVAAGGGVLSTLLTTGWAGAALLIAVVLVLVGAVCWVVNDPQRPDRLALLIATWRGRTPDGLAPSGEPGPPRAMNNAAQDEPDRGVRRGGRAGPGCATGT